jgi:hypothetical protein
MYMLHDNIDNGSFLRTHKLFLQLQKSQKVFEVFIFITYLQTQYKPVMGNI